MSAIAYPDGPAWRCSCGFTCDDDGPERCPHDGNVLMRVAASIPLTKRPQNAPTEES